MGPVILEKICPEDFLILRGGFLCLLFKNSLILGSFKKWPFVVICGSFYMGKK